MAGALMNVQYVLDRAAYLSRTVPSYGARSATSRGFCRFESARMIFQTN